MSQISDGKGQQQHFIFTKSGSTVRIVPGEGRTKLVTVARVDTGKQMLVPRRALIPLKRWRALLGDDA